MGDALDLWLRIAHRVEGLTLAARVDAVAARLAEVDVAGELSQDHQVEPVDDFGLERRCAEQFREQECGAEVGEEAELAT